MATPSTDLIEQFSEFTGLQGHGGREKAILFLKGNNNNLEQALGAYFDDPNPARYEKQLRYDETQWSSDRQGGAEGTQSQPFQLDDDFGNNNQIASLTAPSRPPSRQYGPAPPPGFPNTGTAWENNSKEDREYDEAIKRSLADQQTGIINSSGHEVVPDTEVNDRRRIPGEPAFLKHMLKPDFLPALINVLHSIPSIHDNMMRTSTLLGDYGHNPQWWSGESIESSSVVFYDDAATTTTVDSSCPPMVAEVQRLLAFLDKTERSYGSAEALSRVHAISVLEQTGTARKTLMFRFLETWDSVDPSQSLFQSTVLDKEGTPSEIHGYEIPSGIPNAGNEPTLIELLDNVVWEKQPNGDFEAENFLDHVAPVQILTIPPHSTWKLNAPRSFFIDRYLWSNKPVIAEMKEENAKHVREIERIDTALKKLQSYKYSPTGSTSAQQKEGDAIKLMEDSIKYLTERSTEREVDKGNVHESVANKSTNYKLRLILQNIKERVEALELEKRKLQYLIAQNSTVLTIPSSTSQNEPIPVHQYVLAGVSTASMRLLVTYVQHETDTADAQWWRLAYDTTRAIPQVSKTIVTESDVLAAAAQGVDDTMLVYVAATALQGPPPRSLPPSLNRFVETDNEAFREELATGLSSGGGPGPAVPVTITGVRTRSDSGASDDSMRVQRDDEAIKMEDRDRPPPYSGWNMSAEDTSMDSQPEMQEKGRPGLFGRIGRKSSSEEGM